jgi:UDP-N-acetylmuramyl pentapeptide phosphotransferase/UDP-N-acetylglucosamine-1-phosphate transferase
MNGKGGQLVSLFSSKALNLPHSPPYSSAHFDCGSVCNSVRPISILRGPAVHLLVLLVSSAVLGWALTGLLLRALSSAAHRAVPNERSMHVVPTPVGGGLAVVAAILVMVPLWKWPLPADIVVILSSAAVLSVVSAVDHYRPLWPITRFVAQAVAVAIALSLLSEAQRLVPQFPLWLERVGLGIAWLWLINLTNFMDGIDGIAGAEVALVAIGVAAILTWRMGGGAHSFEAAIALATAGACLGYLVWNWAPARIFMGDAGSIPLGFLMGWLLLDLALRGAWAAALILPLLFGADATLTLLRRVFAGEKPWKPHRTHFYQRAVQGGASPPEVVAFMTLCNITLIILALQSIRRPVANVAAAVAVAVLFLVILAQWAKGKANQPGA